MEKHRLAHIVELSETASRQNYMTNSHFLRPEEAEEIAGMGLRSFFFYGGREGAERVIAFFLPDYLSKEEALKEQRQSDEVISCLKISPLAGRFSQELTHRDFLGALLGLGINREFVGDIVMQGNIAYAFVLSSIVEEIELNLRRVSFERVDVEVIPCASCDIKPSFAIVEFTVASLRIDLAIAGAFNLSREKAKKLIEGKLVLVPGVQKPDPSTPLREGVPISVKGFGKFRFEGVVGMSKKGKERIRVSIYK